MNKVMDLGSKYQSRFLEIAQEGFERELVFACFANLETPGPLCFNNFAYAFRELLRHIFHRLAPSDSVKKCDWYRPDITSRDGITRAQRAKFLIQGGLSDYYVKEKLNIDIELAISELKETYEHLNNFTHIQASTFNLGNSQVEKLAEQCLESGRLLLEGIAECRMNVICCLEEDIDNHLINNAISETFNEIDELATHHIVEAVYVDSCEILEIGPKELRLLAEGDVEVVLQYGSSSDVRNDIGETMNESFPFSSELHIDFKRPLGKYAKVKNFQVDTSSWFE